MDVCGMYESESHTLMVSDPNGRCNRDPLHNGCGTVKLKPQLDALMELFVLFIAAIVVVKLLAGRSDEPPSRSQRAFHRDELGPGATDHVSYGLEYDPERPWTPGDFDGDSSAR